MKVIAKNKKAYFNYNVGEVFVAGMELLGSEVKSIKNGQVSFEGSYITFNKKGMFIKNLHVAEYKFETVNKHDPLRPKQLLLHKDEINRIELDLKKNSATIAPLSILANKRGFLKLEFAIVTGKNKADKRQHLIEKEHRKEANEISKAFGKKIKT